MTYEEFVPIFTMLTEEKKKQDDFIRCLPHSISEAFFDNEYVESLDRQVSFLMETLFEDKELLESVYNLMYEYNVWDTDEATSVTLEDKLAYIKNEHFS